MSGSSTQLTDGRETNLVGSIKYRYNDTVYDCYAAIALSDDMACDTERRMSDGCRRDCVLRSLCASADINVTTEKKQNWGSIRSESGTVEIIAPLFTDPPSNYNSIGSSKENSLLSWYTYLIKVHLNAYHCTPCV